jgi:hypothetical protein
MNIFDIAVFGPVPGVVKNEVEELRKVKKVYSCLSGRKNGKAPRAAGQQKH